MSKAAYRAEALTLAKLSAAEKHGKRLDDTSQERRVRDREPLVFGSLDLRAEYDKHIQSAKMNQGLKKPVLHALIQFPTELTVDAETEQFMLDSAIAFVNSRHGGDAVFAARLDRDEDGRHTVDVFFSPKYEKHTKSKGVETWISTTKHGKELALKHQDEITRRSTKIKEKTESKIKHRSEDAKARSEAITSPRAVGIAMQTELSSFMFDLGFDMSPRREKNEMKPDRVDPETFKARKDAEHALAEAEEIRSKAKAELSLAEQSKREAEDILNDVKSFKDYIIYMHDAMSSFIHDVAEKLGVSPKLKEIEAKVIELKKEKITSAKQQLIKAVFEKKRAQEISNPDPIQDPLSNPDPIQEHVDDEDNDRDMSPSI